MRSFIKVLMPIATLSNTYSSVQILGQNGL